MRRPSPVRSSRWSATCRWPEDRYANTLEAHPSIPATRQARPATLGSVRRPPLRSRHEASGPATGISAPSTWPARSVQYPGRTKQQVGDSFARFLLQRAEKRKQGFADLQDADIHRFLEPLGDGVDIRRIAAPEMRLAGIGPPGSRSRRHFERRTASLRDERGRASGPGEARDAPAIHRTSDAKSPTTPETLRQSPVPGSREKSMPAASAVSAPTSTRPIQPRSRR